MKLLGHSTKRGETCAKWLVMREPALESCGARHPGREATNLPAHFGACAPGSSYAGSLATISDAMYSADIYLPAARSAAQFRQ